MDFRVNFLALSQCGMLLRLAFVLVAKILGYLFEKVKLVSSTK